MNGKDIERLDRNNEIWKLYIASFTQEEIGDKFGITKQRVGQILKAIHAALPVNHIEEWRMLQVAQIEVGIRALWDRYQDGQHSAHQDMRALFAERAKILGLYKEPSTFIGTDFDDEWDKVFDRITNDRVIDG